MPTKRKSDALDNGVDETATSHTDPKSAKKTTANKKARVNAKTDASGSNSKATDEAVAQPQNWQDIKLDDEDEDVSY